MVDYDVVVVGSGFGGSVTALRLTETGYRVGVLEAGRRFADEELATTSWQLRKFLWAPALGCYGIQRIHLLRDLVVLARYGRGSNAMALLKTVATDGASDTPRWRQFVRFAARHPVKMVRSLSVRRWSERTVILLVMQTLDNSLTTYRRRGRLTSRQGHGKRSPTFIPAGFQASQLTAQYIGGTAGSTWGELFEVPMTAHFLGGCPMGTTANDGVIDPYHRVHGYPGLSVVDGSVVSANLGVNPALTITALAERAFALWPNKGEPDPRPAPGEDSQRLDPTPPRTPAVPPGAPAARGRS